MVGVCCEGSDGAITGGAAGALPGTANGGVGVVTLDGGGVPGSRGCGGSPKLGRPGLASTGGGMPTLGEVPTGGLTAGAVMG